MKSKKFTNNNQIEKQEHTGIYWPIGDIVVAILMIIYAILMFVGAQFFPHRARMGFITSAKFTPILLSILIIILCLILIIRTIKSNSKISIIDWWRELIASETLRRSFILILIIGLYIFFIGKFSFLIINTMYLLVIYSYLKIGTWKMIIFYSLVGGIIVSWMIPYIFQMPLP